MAPDTSNGTTAALGDLGVLCTSAEGWAAEQAGRSVSAVIAALYNSSESLIDPNPRVYDDVTPNVVQCSAGGGECPMLVGPGASKTGAGERTAIWVVAEDATVDASWRMTCYVEVEVRVANLELMWVGKPARLE